MAEKKVALVTGAGRGIGAACCRALAEEGFRIGIHYRSSKEEAEKLASELPDAFTLCANLSVPEEIDEMVARLKEEPGRVDVLVNNAGYNRNGLMIRMKLDDYDAIAEVARGTWYLTKNIVRRFMMRADNARIINISSVVGHTGNAGQMPYTMVKAGLDAMVKSLALELGERNILVNSVAPGFISTDMTSDLPEEVQENLLSRIPLGRMGTPEEVAEVVAFLATKGHYIQGSVVHVNGGLYCG